MGFLSDLFGGGQRKDIKRSTEAATGSVNRGAKAALGELAGGFGSARENLTDYGNRAISVLKPMADSGTAYADLHDRFMGVKGKEAQQRSYEDFETSPGFESKLDYGQKVLERSAAARGHATAPRLLMELRDYGHRMLGDEYSDYMDRLERGKSQGFQMASGLADTYRSIGGGLADIGAAHGAAAANVHTGKATAIANLQLGQGQAIANTRFSLGDLAGIVGTGFKAYSMR